MPEPPARRTRGERSGNQQGAPSQAGRALSGRQSEDRPVGLGKADQDVLARYPGRRAIPAADELGPPAFVPPGGPSGSPERPAPGEGDDDGPPGLGIEEAIRPRRVTDAEAPYPDGEVVPGEHPRRVGMMGPTQRERDGAQQ